MTEYFDKGELGESDIKAPEIPTTEIKEEIKQEDHVNNEVQDCKEEYPSRFEGIKDAIVSIFHKSRPIFALVGIVLGLVFLISLQTQKEIKADKIAQLSSEITDIRKEREQVYSQCMAQCDAQREVFDAQVILKKKQVKELELSD